MIQGRHLLAALTNCQFKMSEGFILPQDREYSFSTDTRTLRRDEVFLAISGERFDGHDYIREALKIGAILIIGENQRLRNLAANEEERKKIVGVENSLAALAEIAKAHRRQCRTKILAITGSAGKTTTKELIKNCLSTTFACNASAKSFNNQIGVPLTLLQMEERHDFGIVELGINHVGEMENLTEWVSPDMSLITNIGMSHLAGLINIESVAN